MTPLRPQRRGAAAQRLWLLYAILMLAAAHGAVGAAPASPVAVDPQVAEVGIQVTSISHLNLRKETFDASLYLWLKWRGSRDPTNIEFVEGEWHTVGDADSLVLPDGTRYRCWRIDGTFPFTPQMERYPFDHQQLCIAVENLSYPKSELTLRLDPQVRHLAPTTRVPGWRLEAPRCLVTTHVYGARAFGVDAPGSGEYSRALWDVSLQRDSASMAFKILVPLLVIVCVAYLACYVPASDSATRMGLDGATLLAAVASQFVVSSQMPELSYLTFADRLYLGAYVLLFASFLEAVIICRLMTATRKSAAEKVGRAWRVLFPLLAVLLVLMASIR